MQSFLIVQNQVSPMRAQLLVPYKWNQCKASLRRRQRGQWKNVFGCFVKDNNFDGIIVYTV